MDNIVVPCYFLTHSVVVQRALLVDLQSLHGFHCYDNIAPNAKCQRVLVLALCLVYFCRLWQTMKDGFPKWKLNPNPTQVSNFVKFWISKKLRESDDIRIDTPSRISIASALNVHSAHAARTSTVSPPLHCRCFQTKTYDVCFVSAALTFWISTTKTQWCLRYYFQLTGWQNTNN